MVQRLKKTGIGLLCVFNAGFLWGHAMAGNPPSAGPQVSDYIRYVETDPAAESKLQTALTRFSKGDLIVDLVAVLRTRAPSVKIEEEKSIPLHASSIPE